MTDIIIGIILAILIGSAAFYIYKAKKSGKKCIGCPYAEGCNSKNHCHCQEEQPR